MSSRVEADLEPVFDELPDVTSPKAAPRRIITETLPEILGEGIPSLRREFCDGAGELRGGLCPRTARVGVVPGAIDVDRHFCVNGPLQALPPEGCRTVERSTREEEGRFDAAGGEHWGGDGVVGTQVVVEGQCDREALPPPTGHGFLYELLCGYGLVASPKMIDVLREDGLVHDWDDLRRRGALNAVTDLVVDERNSGLKRRQLQGPRDDVSPVEPGLGAPREASWA